MFIVFDLSPEAIAILNKLVDEKGTTRSEFINNQIISIDSLLDAVDSVLCDATSEDECLPPHPSYTVDGDDIRRLGSAFERITQPTPAGV